MLTFSIDFSTALIHSTCPREHFLENIVFCSFWFVTCLAAAPVDVEAPKTISVLSSCRGPCSSSNGNTFSTSREVEHFIIWYCYVIYCSIFADILRTTLPSPIQSNILSTSIHHIFSVQYNCKSSFDVNSKWLWTLMATPPDHSIENRSQYKILPRLLLLSCPITHIVWMMSQQHTIVGAQFNTCIVAADQTAWIMRCVGAELFQRAGVQITRIFGCHCPPRTQAAQKKTWIIFTIQFHRK